MTDEKDTDIHGLAPFRQALQRQEGAFHRRATVIMNAPKKLGGPKYGEELASKVAERNVASSKKPDDKKDKSDGE